MTNEEQRVTKRSLFGRLKWSVESLFMHNFFLYFCTKKAFHFVPFLLPHEKDYFGLKLLLPAGKGFFLDVGANDGVSALSFRKINSTYRILSLEPNPMHRRSLERVRRRIEGFDFRMCAAGDVAGTAVLKMPTYKGVPNHSGAFCAPEQQAAFEAEFPDKIVQKLKYVIQSVPVIRIDELNLSPTVVKVDVEGFELKVLYGMSETIKRCRPVLMLENNALTIETVITFVKSFGYEVLVYDYHHNCLKPYGGGRTRNVLCRIARKD